MRKRLDVQKQNQPKQQTTPTQDPEETSSNQSETVKLRFRTTNPLKIWTNPSTDATASTDRGEKKRVGSATGWVKTKDVH